MKGPFGLLLVGGGIILIVGLFTGKIVFPGALGSSLDPAAAKNNTLLQNISLQLFGQGSFTPAQQAANAAKEPKQNVGVKPDKNGKCPPGTSYLPWDGKCYNLAGV